MSTTGQRSAFFFRKWRNRRRMPKAAQVLENAGMVFVADDLGAWLVALLADAGRRRLTTLILGSEQERALRQAATAAVQLTAAELSPSGSQQAEQVAMALSEVFGMTMPDAPQVGHLSLLEALQAGVAEKLAVLDDASLTGTGESAADSLGVTGGVLGDELASHLVREILIRASRGGPLAPLADQLNHDVTHRHSVRLEGMLSRLADDVRDGDYRGPLVLHGLPADAANFTGRDTELRQLMDTLTDAVSKGGVVGVHAIDGMAGIGKTVFAVHAAHQLAKRFPDGQIFLSLEAHTPGSTPIDPADALATLLRIRGFRAGQIPPGVQARSVLWRDHLVGKKVLLVLDDAGGSAQVQPLLPGTPGTRVLITSRRALTALPEAVPLTLDTLPPGQAATLFTRLATRPIDTSDPDAKAIARIVQLCGYLPLAISLVAGRLRHKAASWTAADLATELANTQDRLASMRAEDHSITAAFDLSHRTLPLDLQRLFAYLGLHPGSEFDACAAAALIGSDPATAADRLDQLSEYHFLSEPIRGRYSMHDLIRAYAQTRAAHGVLEGREVALERLLDYYQHTAEFADRYLVRHTHSRPHNDPAPELRLPDLPDRDAALAWLRTERANLLACLQHATTHEQHRRLIALTAAIAGFLRQEGPWPQAADLHYTAAAAAHCLDDRLAEADALRELGIMRRRTGDYEAAADLHERARRLYEQLGDRLGQAHTLHHLSLVRRRTGDHAAAADLLEAAWALYRQLGDRLGQATSLHDLAVVRRMMGDYEAAADLHERAEGLYEQLGDRLGQAHTLHHLGVVRRMAGDYAAAAELHERAGGLYEQLGDRHGQAHTLHHLGKARRMMGNCAAAADLQERAQEIYQQLGDRHGQANALHELGVVSRMAGDYAAAADLHERAGQLFRQVGDRQGEVDALKGLGAVLGDAADDPLRTPPI
jgi:tetratricopeptide (TPR) repeat protein